MSAHPPSAVIARLEPLLLPRRVQRMRAVLATRSDHVAFVFERMTDPHNLSAALRSLDAFSFQDAHWIAPGEKLGLSHLITRGTERWLSLHLHADVQACVSALREQGYAIWASHVPPVVGAEPASASASALASVSLHGLDLSRRTALLFGNEHAGVSAELLALADGRFHIATLGFAESLNLSVAVAICAFHARQELERLGRAGCPLSALLLPAPRREALYAEWLRASVRRAEAVLGE